MKAGHNISSLRYVGIEKVEMPPRGGYYERLLLQLKSFHIHALNTMASLISSLFYQSIQTILYLPGILCLTAIPFSLQLVRRNDLLHRNVLPVHLSVAARQ